MQKFIFTFGIAHQNAKHAQPIYADSREEARKKMFELWGGDWCWQYTEAEYKKRNLDYKELEPIYCE